MEILVSAARKTHFNNPPGSFILEFDRRPPLATSAGFLVFIQTSIEIAGAIASPFRLFIYLCTGRAAERRRVRDALAAAPAAPPPAPPQPAVPREGRPLVIFISAGEASGEMHAANLLLELKARHSPVRCIAFGGARLAAAGAETLLSLERKAGMGLLHGLASVPEHTCIAKQFVEMLDRERPDVCVFVDNPGFHLILATLARKRGTRCIQYICPQTWAWAPWRHRRMRRDLTAALAIVPFEKPYFESRGVHVEYVGHPLGDEMHSYAAAAAPKRAGGETLCITLFPGSRESEIRRNLPVMLKIARRIQDAFPGAVFETSMRDAGRAALVRQWIQAEWIQKEPGATRVNVHEGNPAVLLQRSTLALAKSGTGTLEIAYFKTPQVVVYKLARRFDLFLKKLLLAVPHISMLNLLSNARVVPEFVFYDDREADVVADYCIELLRDPHAREQQIASLGRAREVFGSPGAAARAATFVLKIAGVENK